MFTLRLPELEDFLETALPNTEDLTRIKREALHKLHRKVSNNSPKPDQAHDDFVNWDFRKDWRREKLPLGIAAGTDYDYFNAAVSDAITMFRNYGMVDPDRAGNIVYGPAPGAFSNMFGVWQNGTKVSENAPLSGPWVDFGPTADYALFLEKSTTKLTNNLNVKVLYGIGVIHAIAERLSAKYTRVHRIFAHTQKPSSGNRAAIQREKRAAGESEAIRIFPLIRIMHRHWRR